MNITKNELIQIINEEIQNMVEQNVPRPMPSLVSTMIDDDEAIDDVGWIADDTEWYNVLLDFAGLIPGYGEIFDAINALDYLRKGNYLFAALSAISVIPTIGDALGKGGKLVALLAKMGKTGVYIQKGAKVASTNRQQIKKASDFLRANKDTIRAVAKNGKTVKNTIRANKDNINGIFDYLSKNSDSDELVRNIPNMKKALDDFASDTVDISQPIAGTTLPATEAIPPMASWSGDVAISESFNRDRLLLLSGISK